MTEKVRECDAHLGYLLDQIEASDKLRDRLHLIVTSDHGMEQINGTTRPIYLEDYVDMSRARAFGTPTVMSIFVRARKLPFTSDSIIVAVSTKGKDIYYVLRNLRRIPHAQIYRRQEIPDRYHYKGHARVGDLLLVVEPGYEVHQRRTIGVHL